jgi:hypothetical protein
MDECTDTGGDLAEAADGAPINGVYVDTGNSVKTDVTEGLMTGTSFSDLKDARLTRSSDTRKVDGIDLDNIALWEHLLEDSTHGLSYCDGSDIQAISDIVARSDAMSACLVEYQKMGAIVQIFDDSILNSPRVGTAPRLWHYNLGSGLAFRPVKSFDVVYIHGLWFDDKDQTVFYPDDGTGGDITLKKMKEIEQVTAYLLLDSMVSTKVLTTLGGNTTYFQPTIYE